MMRTNTPDSGFSVSSPEGSPSRLSTEEDERIKEKYFLNVEDNNSIQVEEDELWRRHPCQICSHVFHSNADYIAHGRIHFQQSLFPTTPSFYPQYFYPPHPFYPSDMFWNGSNNQNCSKSSSQTASTMSIKSQNERKLKRKRKDSRKNKSELKEDLDPETLKKLRKCELDVRDGQWCRVCSKRFSSREQLIDHLSYDKDHAINAASSGASRNS